MPRRKRKAVEHTFVMYTAVVNYFHMSPPTHTFCIKRDDGSPLQVDTQHSLLLKGLTLKNRIYNLMVRNCWTKWIRQCQVLVLDIALF